jgi:hypothetical protein
MWQQPRLAACVAKASLRTVSKTWPLTGASPACDLRHKSRQIPRKQAAMMATMLPGRCHHALQTITDPNVLGKILPALRPEQKSSVAVGVIKAMAVKDIHSAFAWANSLGMADRDRDTLMANCIEAAVAGGKLDLPGVAELNRNLNLDAESDVPRCWFPQPRACL